MTLRDRSPASLKFRGDSAALEQETIDGVFRLSPSGAWDPMYLNYTFGTLLSLELRHEIELRPGFTLKRFHDALLDCRTLPNPLIRELIG